MNRNEKMQQLIQEYQALQAPQNGYERVQKAIEEGKKEAARKRRNTLLRGWCISAAAVLLAAILCLNVNTKLNEPDKAGGTEQGQDSMLSKAGAEIETAMSANNGDSYEEAVREAGEEEGLLPFCDETADIGGTEAVSGCTEGKTGSQTVQGNADYIDMLICQYKLDMGESGGQPVQGDCYEVLVDNDDWFTLVFYAGQGQQGGSRKYYNVDKTTGRLVKLEDLFCDGQDYDTVIRNELQAQINEAMAEDAGDTYWTQSGDSVSGFYEIGEDQNYYLNDAGDIVIVMGESETEGFREFVISIDLFR